MNQAKALIYSISVIITVLSFSGCTDINQNYIQTNTIEISEESKINIESETEAEQSNPPILSPLYDVVRVVDGDTIVVNIDDENVKIRLIGVDTPESVHPNKEKNTPEGKQASEWLNTLLTDEQVYLEYDEEKEDYYGRTLAYVYLKDGTTMVNCLLLESGMAQTMKVKPNVKYADEFEEIQATACDLDIGFWGTGFFN